MSNDINLDSYINYRAEYSAIIERASIAGDELVGLCPFHNDKNNSFSANLKTGQWHCFAENESGNFISFWAKLHGMDTKTAYKDLLHRYNLDTPQKPAGGGKKQPAPYSLEQYSQEKQIPADFLSDVCHCSTGKDRDGITFLKTQYLDEHGKETATRKRYGKKDFRWQKGSKGKISFYGEWRLSEIRHGGWVILVEGESDTQTLWLLGYPALGVPGATMMREDQAALLDGLQVYIHREPDQGGKVFTQKITDALTKAGHAETVKVWECSSKGKKDPSDLYLSFGDAAKTADAIQDALNSAVVVDMKAAADQTMLHGAPVNLKIPDGWLLTDEGIITNNSRTNLPEVVCATPILLTQRIKSMDAGDEKIEIAFKRDGAWERAIYPRSVIFDARNIKILTDTGCTITSENSKKVVSFLGSLEAANIQTIPKVDATGVFGWQPGRRFIPGCGEGIVLDIDPSQRAMAAAYCTEGTLQEWVDCMRPHRTRDKFRFILAAAFAAPLLKIVKQRIFFVYNWGSSKAGKTAALKAALSAWGDPERLMVNFNSTQVGLERTAAFYCDLPLGIDERQLAGNNQGSLEKIVYMISSGTGKLRGAKNGGIQAVQQWRTVALATGEEPLSTETSQTGINTRVLEIYGGPFESEQDASDMHQQTALHHGHAGPEFIRRLLELSDSEIRRQYDELHNWVRQISDGKNSSHVAGIAAVALADAYAGTWIFGETPAAAMAGARAMAEHILKDQVQQNSFDVNENAVQYITDWVLGNQNCFGSNSHNECYGFMSNSGNIAYIYPSILNTLLQKAGYSPRKTLKYMGERELVGISETKNGVRQYSVSKWFESRVSRFVEFYIGKISQKVDPAELDEIVNAVNGDAGSSGAGGDQNPDGYHATFTEITGDDEPLPF